MNPHKMIREAEEKGLIEIGLNRANSFTWWSRKTLSGGILSSLLRIIPGLHSVLRPFAEKLSQKRVLKKARRSRRAFEDLYSQNGIYLIHTRKKNIIESPASWEAFVEKTLSRGKGG